MKYHISDLLEDYREDTLISEEETPLSLERIQLRTMEIVAPQKKRRRILPVILAAALAVSLLAVTAIAGERAQTVSDWFRTALNQNARQDAEIAQQWNTAGIWKNTIGESRLAAIDTHGKIVNQSITREGTTITLVALYGDEYILNLYFRVEAPEGTVLPDGLDYAFSSRDYYEPVQVPPGYTTSSMYRPDIEVMQDEDPGDNVKDFLVSVHHWPYEQRQNGILKKSWAFHDEVTKTFLIEGLFHETEGGSFEKLLPGYFTFDITHPHEVQRREIDVTGLNYSGHTDWGNEGAGFDFTVEPIRLTLSPFSAEIENRFTCSEENRVVSMEFQVILKDGTTQRNSQYFSYKREADTYAAAVQFSNPIDLEQIDYVWIGDPNFGQTLHKAYPK